METDTIRRADASDRDAIADLVAGAGLPPEGVLDEASVFFVAERGSRVVGCCGLEIYGEDALLRSVAVAAAERGRGTGARLVAHALSDARERGLASVFLLTTTAPGYFPRFGFSDVARDDVPARVRESDEFRGICPSTATVMRLALAPASAGARMRERS
jgi:amino-acid N-acetyltransferase